MGNELPDPKSAPELFDGLLTRRVVAYFIDLAVISVLVLIVIIVGLIAGLLTAGLSLAGLFLAVPGAIVLYYAVTLGSSKRATVGMGIMDIVLTPTRDEPLDGWKAFLHPLVFWVTCWILPPFSVLFALFSPRRRLIHDLIVGTLMVRRSPMQQHWDNYTS